MISRHRLGLRGRLFIAFGALTALTLLASIVSWVSYNRLGDELNQVVEGNIHTLSLMADLKEQGTTITLVSPTLLAAKDEETRQQIRQELNLNIALMADLLPRISAATRDHQAQQTLFDQIDTLKNMLAELDENVALKLQIQAQKRSENQRLRWVASNFLSDINTLTENVQQNLFSQFNQDFPDAWVVMNNFGRDAISTINADLQRLYRIKADVNLLINLVDRAQHLPDLNSLIATQTHSDEIITRIQHDLEAVEKVHGVQALSQTVINIVYLTRGENNMFTIRSQERGVLGEGEALLTRMREQLGALNQLVTVQTNKAEAAAKSSAENARVTIQNSRILMLSMVAASLLFSILIVWLYVGRNMVARITSLDTSMRGIANGNLDTRVQVKGQDEIGTMARSLLSFRDQLSTLQEELVQAGKLAALGQLSAGIAHEINQPLSAIGHYSHNGVRLIQAGRLDETEKNLNQISNLTRRATVIITRLKSLARQQQDNFVAVNLQQVVENVLQMLEGDEVRKQTRIDVDFITLQHRVCADPIQLEQVLLNLLTNALDAIRDQTEKHISISCVHNSDRLDIYVSDNGPGISSELGESIFEPFFTTKRRGQNLGLGLSISYNIVKNFGGKLSVESSSSAGASFCIQLPEYRRKHS
ncbi:ATP-binding protein [Aliamphritea hakodatensis]|uniref:ATP-binding protein n=1 Tax=Aliamphritea hakodatensis TaxID=2895352 RepID=UPI0022FD919F|nr:ATP-binding protein [Aliamphritea hakodatensis]